jgi:hypothetical protein
MPDDLPHYLALLYAQEQFNMHAGTDCPTATEGLSLNRTT